MVSSCELIRTDLVALERGELTSAEEAAAKAHVASCAACARELRRLRRTVELVARATDIEPSAASSARLRRTLAAALVAPAEPVHDGTIRGRFLSAWDRARLRYEQSATVRRFTIASVGLHAAAAILLAVLLARTPDPIDRRTTVSIGTHDVVVTLPDGPRDLDGSTAALPAFDAASDEGVAASSAPGVRFPNRTAAERHAAAATASGRAGAMRAVLGVEAPRAQVALARGLDWLGAQRGADGGFGGGADRVAETAAAVFAFASEGRTTLDDVGLAASVQWLERSADAADAVDRALSVRALTAQYVMDFGRLTASERTRRAGAVTALAARIETDAHRGPRVGAPAVPDAVASIAALADVRAAGLRDTGPALVALVRSLECRRTPDGRLAGTSGADGVSLTAALVEVASDAGAPPLSDGAATLLQNRIAALAPTSTHDAALGVAALAALGRPVDEPLRAVVASQRADGRWVRARGPRAKGSDVSETALGVVALTRAYRR